MTQDRSKPVPPLSDEVRKLLWLAGPLILAHAGNHLMGIVDTAMVGRLTPGALGGIGIGNGIYMTVTCLGLGCVLGIEPVVSQALGAGEEKDARHALWQGVYVALIASLPLMVLAYGLTFLLEPVGVDAYTAMEARRYVIGRLPGTVPFLLFITLRSFLQAKHITGPILLGVAVANIANVFFNGLLMFGDGALNWAGLPAVGLPALGVLGAGFSTSAVSVVSVVILAISIGIIPTPHDPQRRGRDFALMKKIFWLGVPIGLQITAEIAFFVSGAVLAGTLGQANADSHQIALALASLSFTATLGIASATTMRVGRHVGAGSRVEARRSGMIGLAVGLAFMSVSAVVFLSIPEVLAGLLTNSAATIKAAVPLLLVAALFQLSDGVQIVAACALRGAGDTRVPLVINLVGHYLIGLPVLLWLVFATGLGTVGIWWGFCVGLTVVAVALTHRFFVLSSRPIARV